MACAAVLCPLGVLLVFLFHKYGWQPIVDPAMDEQCSRVDLECEVADAFARDLERVRNLPQLNFDPERLGS